MRRRASSSVCGRPRLTPTAVVMEVDITIGDVVGVDVVAVVADVAVVAAVAAAVVVGGVVVAKVWLDDNKAVVDAFVVGAEVEVVAEVDFMAVVEAILVDVEVDVDSDVDVDVVSP